MKKWTEENQGNEGAVKLQPAEPDQWGKKAPNSNIQAPDKFQAPNFKLPEPQLPWRDIGEDGWVEFLRKPAREAGYD
jgi:hypothetical protein